VLFAFGSNPKDEEALMRVIIIRQEELVIRAEKIIVAAKPLQAFYFCNGTY
jgi:hypothetical protein